MRIFEGGGWGGKINFVDKNNVLVGFDMSQSCCEHFGWYIIDEISPDTYTHENCRNAEQLNVELEDYYFDTEFIEYINGSETVAFKLLKRKNGAPKYLHLFNHHNGYYSHGFDMTINDKTIHEGSI